MKPATRSKMAFAITLLVTSSACTPGMYQSLFSPGGLQVSPSSTTVGVNQSLAYQVSGGTPPYQYQVNGIGSIDSNGNYQSGTSTGQAQIQVTDSSNSFGSATVSVVQSGYGSFPTPYQGQSNEMTRRLDASTAGVNSSQAQVQDGWRTMAATGSKPAPWVLGQLLAVDERPLDQAGDAIKSKFIETSLKHPVVRMDTLIENKNVVATRAVIEDQFLVTLNPGYSEADLIAVVTKAGAHISKYVDPGIAYLVSMNPIASPNGAMVSSDFFSNRLKLKDALRSVGTVSPNYLFRAPSSENGPRR